jgi:hypothetical protein
MLLGTIKRIKLETERGPLCRKKIKILKILARQFPEAHELLQRCSQNAPKKRKRFAYIVKETPRHEVETPIAWVRCIWDECANYDTECPEILTEELLEKYSQSSPTAEKNNLPGIPDGAAKSFE